MIRLIREATYAVLGEAQACSNAINDVLSDFTSVDFYNLDGRYNSKVTLENIEAFVEVIFDWDYIYNQGYRGDYYTPSTPYSITVGKQNITIKNISYQTQEDDSEHTVPVNAIDKETIDILSEYISYWIEQAYDSGEFEVDKK